MKWQAMFSAIVALLTPLVGCETSATPETEAAVPSERRMQREGRGAFLQHASMRSALIDLSADGRELRQAFNAATGKVRVMLLVSPG